MTLAFCTAARAWRAAVVALAAVLAVPAAAQLPDMSNRDDAARQLLEEQRELESVRAKEEALAADVEELARERARLNEQLIATARRIQSHEASLSDIEQRMVELAAQESQVRGSIEQRRQAIGTLLASLQRLSRNPPPALITHPDDALKMVRSAMMMASLYPELRFQADRLAQELDRLLRLQRQLASESQLLRQETAGLEQERAQIDALMAVRRAMLARREDELERAREIARAHAESVTYLNDLVKRMDEEFSESMAQYEAELLAWAEEQERDRQQAERQARTQAAEARQVAFVSPGRITPAMPFAAAKGTLPVPASGVRVRHFGGPDGYGGTSKGLALETREAAQITSPADGWIVYADEFRGYGQLLIINAGGGYHILLAGMRQIDVGLGQFVLAGEPVGVMGGASRAEGRGLQQGPPTLYIEFRKDGQPIDPNPWWAEVPEKVEG